MAKLLLIGQAPGQGNGRPFDGASGRRIARLAGILDVRDAFEPVNLLRRFPGKSIVGKGDAFPLAEARDAANRLLPRMRGHRVVVAGLATARALGLGRAPILRWFSTDGFEAAVIPHPSGVNHWWNAPENVTRASRFLRRAARAAGSCRARPRRPRAS